MNRYQEGKLDGYEHAVSHVLRIFQNCDDGKNVLDLSAAVQAWLYENGAVDEG